MGTSLSPCFEGQYNGDGGGVRHGRGWLALPDGGSLSGDWVAGRGLPSFPFPLNWSSLCPVPLN